MSYGPCRLLSTNVASECMTAINQAHFKAATANRHAGILSRKSTASPRRVCFESLARKFFDFLELEVPAVPPSPSPPHTSSTLLLTLSDSRTYFSSPPSKEKQKKQNNNHTKDLLTKNKKKKKKNSTKPQRVHKPRAATRVPRTATRRAVMESDLS